MSEVIIISKVELKELIQTSIKDALKELRFDEKTSHQEFLTIQEAAAFLNLKVPTLYSYTSNLKIPFIKRGKKLYFEKCRLEDWLNECRHESVVDIKQRLSK